MGDAQRPPVLWALDEVANIAPIKSLPSIVSEAGGQGLQVLACLQDLSQARARWGVAAEGFLSLFGTKVVLPGIGDRPTLETLSILAGDWDRPYVAYNYSTGRATTHGPGPFNFTRSENSQDGYTYTTQREPELTPAEVANIPSGDALLLTAGAWTRVQLAPCFKAEPWLSALAKAPEAIQMHGGVDTLPWEGQRRTDEPMR